MKAALSHAAYAKFINSARRHARGCRVPTRRARKARAANARRAQTRPVAQDVRAGHVRCDDSQRGAHELNAIDLAWDTVAPVLEARGG